MRSCLYRVSRESAQASSRALTLVIILLTTLSIYSLVDPGGPGVVTTVGAQEKSFSTNYTDLYYTRYIDTGLDVYQALALDNRIVVLGGERRGESIVKVFWFSEDLGTGVSREYVVHGRVVSIASESSTGSLVVVGTSLGEIAVIDLVSGRVSYIQASRDPIEKVFVSSVRGSYYIVGFDGRFIYAYRYMAPGWLEIGPINSTALLGFFPASIYDIVPLARVGPSVIEYDLSRILLAYTPPRVVLVMNITDETGAPVDRAVVTLTYLSNRDIYYTALSINGSVEIEVPVLDVNGSLYQLRITHPLYETYTDTIYIPPPRRVNERIYVSVTLRRGVGVSEPVRPVPERSFIAVLELYLSPDSYQVFQRGVIVVPTRIYRVYLFEPTATTYPFKYIAVLSSVDGIYLVYYDSTYRILRVGGLDYVYYYLSIRDPYSASAVVSHDGRYVVVGVDERLYVFGFEPALSRHVAYSSYVFMDRIGSLSLSYDYKLSVSTLDNRINLFYLDNGLLVPCLRTGNYSGYRTDTRLLYTYLYRDGSRLIDIGSGRVYLTDTSRYTRDVCPIERVYISVVPEIESIEKRYIGVEGRALVYRGEALVAVASIRDSLGEVYIPYSTYDIVVESVQTGRVRYSGLRIDPGTNTLRLVTGVLPVDLLVRVRIQNSSVMLPPVVPSTGLILVIRDTETGYSLELSMRENPVGIYLSRGRYSLGLVYSGYVIAYGEVSVTGPGIAYGELVSNSSTLYIEVLRSVDKRPVDPGTVNMSIVFRGPLWSGLAVTVSPPARLVLPVGIYDVVVASRFYMETSAYIELFRDVNKTIEVTPTVFDLRIRLIDTLGRVVGRALVELRNIRTGAVSIVETNEAGEAVVHNMIYDLYNITIRPYNKTYFRDTSIVTVIDSFEKTLVVDNVMRNLTIVLRDTVSGDIIAPLRIDVYIDNRYYTGSRVNYSIVSMSVPVGLAEIYIRPLPESSRVYIPRNITYLILEDSVVRVYLDRVVYSLEIRAVDRLGLPVDGSLSIVSRENSSLVIRGELRSGLSLIEIPYGRYVINITTPNHLPRSIEITPDIFTNATEKTVVTVTVDNIMIPVSLYVRDQLGLPPRGPLVLEISTEGRVFIRQEINRSETQVQVPRGYNLSIRILPTETNTVLYQTYTRELGPIDTPTNLTIVVNRKIYRVTLSIYNDLGQLIPAHIVLTNRENPRYVYETVSTGESYATISVPAGDYILDVMSTGYTDYTTRIDITSDLSRDVYMHPTIITVLSRFTTLYIGIGIIGVVVAIAYWLRKTISKRLEEEVI